MARSRRRRSPRKRTRSRRRRNPVYAMNSPRRRRYRRYKKSGYYATRGPRYRKHYRRNPPPLAMPLMTDVMYAGIGYMGTKFAVGMALPAFGIAATPPSLTGIAAKLGVAYGVAWAAENFVGRDKFKPVFIGGVVSAIQDFVSLYMAPTFPALAGPGDLGAYYRPALMPPRNGRMLPAPGMGAYVDQSLGAEDMI